MEKYQSESREVCSAILNKSYVCVEVHEMPVVTELQMDGISVL